MGARLLLVLLPRPGGDPPRGEPRARPGRAGRGRVVRPGTGLSADWPRLTADTCGPCSEGDMSYSAVRSAADREVADAVPHALPGSCSRRPRCARRRGRRGCRRRRGPGHGPEPGPKPRRGHAAGQGSGDPAAARSRVVRHRLQRALPAHELERDGHGHRLRRRGRAAGARRRRLQPRHDDRGADDVGGPARGSAATRSSPSSRRTPPRSRRTAATPTRARSSSSASTTSRTTRVASSPSRRRRVSLR